MLHFGEETVSSEEKPLLVKRYASRRLYNTEKSDYVTIEDIAGLIRGGREVQIVDLRSGDDLTRQYLLQIIADHESRGENLLPLNMLIDLVRSYRRKENNTVPELLSFLYDIFQVGQSKLIEDMECCEALETLASCETITGQQLAFYKAIAEWLGTRLNNAEKKASRMEKEDLSKIKSQLSELQKKLGKVEK